MSNPSIRDKVVLVTGASSGIGASLAERAAAKGAKVVLVARREAELKAVAARCGGEANALVVVADVTKRADVQRALDEAVTRFGRVDVWVNNAGRGITRPVLQITDEDVDEMMTVNLKSAIYGMQVAVAHFRTRGTGQVINISSMLGKMPFAGVRSIYGASKFALNALTANLRIDLRQSDPGIHVTLVMPGIVATEFGLNARHGGADSRALPGAQPVEEVADAILGAIESPRAEVYTRPGFHAQVAAYYGAEDVATIESNPPFAQPRPGNAPPR